MSLMDDFKASCVLLEEVSTPDGEGGSASKWVEGAAFEASITYDTSREARAAEKQGVSSLYTVTTDKAMLLKYHDVFKRLTDGKVFRVTSDGDDKRTPDRATFQFSQVTAEEYTLPDNGGAV